MTADAIKAGALLLFAALVQVSIASAIEVAEGHPDVVLVLVIGIALGLRRIERLYKPYHRTLRQLVNRTARGFGYAEPAQGTPEMLEADLAPLPQCSVGFMRKSRYRPVTVRACLPRRSEAKAGGSF